MNIMMTMPIAQHVGLINYGTEEEEQVYYNNLKGSSLIPL